MRQIIFLIFFFSVTANGTTHSLSYNYGFDSSQISENQLDLTNSPASSSVSQSVGYKNEDLIHGFTFSTQLNIQQNDYSSYLIRSSDGIETPLTDNEITTEFLGQLDVQFTEDSHQAFLGVFGHLNSSPFYQKGFRLGYTKGFFGQTTLLGVKFTGLEQNQPRSFFTTANFINGERPSNTFSQEINFFIQQVINSVWKTQLELLTTQKFKERPQSYGVVFKNALALGNQLFNLIEVSYKFEDTSDNLLNERGYFNATDIQTTLTYEPIYDLFLSFSYGIGIEQEDDPRAGTKVQVGTDHFGFGLRYLTEKEIEIQVAGSYSITNTNLEQTQLTGGVLWPL